MNSAISHRVCRIGMSWATRGCIIVLALAQMAHCARPAWSQCTAEPPPALGRYWGSLGSAPGQFDQPRGIAIDSTGNVFVGDTQNYRIQIFTRDGTYVDSWGHAGPDPGDIGSIVDLQIDAAGRLFVMGYPFIKIYTTTGTYLERWFGPDSAQGDTLHQGGGLDIDESGYVYVTDCGRNRIFKLHPDGTYAAPPWGSTGSGPGQFSCPADIAVDRTGTLYVLDVGNDRVQKFTNDGTFLCQWGSSGTGPGQFLQPLSIDTDARGNVYVADSAAHRIQKFSPDGTCLGTWGQYGSLVTRFNQPHSIMVDSCSVFVAERLNHRVQRFDYPPAAFTAIHDPGTGDKLVVRWRICPSTNPSATQAFLSDQPGGEPLEYGQASPIIPIGTGSEFVHVFDALTPYTHYYVSFRLAYGTPHHWSDPYTPTPDDWWWCTYPVFLVHGIYSSPAIWEPMQEAMDDSRVTYVRAVDLGQTCVPEEAQFNVKAQALSEYIEQQTADIASSNFGAAGQEIPLRDIDIIGHSMGGLVARRYIAGDEEWAMSAKGKLVTRLFTLGTPHLGSELVPISCYQSPSVYRSCPAICEMALPLARINRDFSNLKGAQLFTAAGTGGREDFQCGRINPLIPRLDKALTLQEYCPNDGLVSTASAHGGFLRPVLTQDFTVAHTQLHSDSNVIAWVLSLLTVPPSPSAKSTVAGNMAWTMGGAPAQITTDECAELVSGGQLTATSRLAGSGQLSALFTAEGSGIVTWAMSPSGTMWRSDAPPPDSSVVFVQNEDQYALLVPDAMPGAWHVGVDRSSTEAPGVACLRVAVFDSVVASETISNTAPAVGTPIEIFCTLRDAAGPILSSAVSVAVTDSVAVNVATIVLADDGSLPDITAGDGIYSGQWTGPVSPGSFLVQTLAEGATNSGREFTRLLNAPVVYSEGGTGVQPDPRVSVRRIGTVAPNPTGASSLIQWSGAVGSWCKISVLDLRGRVVWTRGLAGEIGRGQIQWSGLSKHGQRVASGVYLVRVEDAAGLVGQKRIVLLR